MRQVICDGVSGKGLVMLGMFSLRRLSAALAVVLALAVAAACTGGDEGDDDGGPCDWTGIPV